MSSWVTGMFIGLVMGRGLSGEHNPWIRERRRLTVPCLSSCDERVQAMVQDLVEMKGDVWQRHKKYFEFQYPKTLDDECPLLKKQLTEGVDSLQAPARPRAFLLESNQAPGKFGGSVNPEPTPRGRTVDYTIQVKEDCGPIRKAYLRCLEKLDQNKSSVP